MIVVLLSYLRSCHIVTFTLSHSVFLSVSQVHSLCLGQPWQPVWGELRDSAHFLSNSWWQQSRRYTSTSSFRPPSPHSISIHLRRLYLHTCYWREWTASLTSLTTWWDGRSRCRGARASFPLGWHHQRSRHRNKTPGFEPMFTREKGGILWMIKSFLNYFNMDPSLEGFWVLLYIEPQGFP